MTVIVAVAALLPRSHLADGNNANDPNPPVTNQKILDRVNALRADISGLRTTVAALQTALATVNTDVQVLKTVAAKRGVAVIRAIPGHKRDGDYLPDPRLFILGSTIEGFHDTLAWGAELNPNSNRGAGPLPAGTYLIEMRQPRPPDDDAACAGRKPLPASTNLRVAGVQVAGAVESNLRCRPMRLNQLGGPAPNRMLFTGSAVVKVDGTGVLGFNFKVPTAWVTTDRPAHSYAGSIMITRLE